MLRRNPSQTAVPTAEARSGLCRGTQSMSAFQSPAAAGGHPPWAAFVSGILGKTGLTLPVLRQIVHPATSRASGTGPSTASTSLTDQAAGVPCHTIGTYTPEMRVLHHGRAVGGRAHAFRPLATTLPDRTPGVDSRRDIIPLVHRIVGDGEMTIPCRKEAEGGARGRRRR
jgi:hypothetical protein